VTQEEKQYLEELRKQYGLRSIAQVVRLGIELLEKGARPYTFLTEGSEGLRRNRELVPDVQESALRKLGLAGVELDDGRAAAGAGLSPDQPPGGEHST
jgi:hypothetical protein